MIYYIIFGSMLSFCVLLQLAEIFNINANQIDKALFWFFSIILVVMAAIRNNVGLDFENYKRGYYAINNSSLGIIKILINANYFEPLYNLLNIIAPSFQFLIIICAGLGVLTKVIYYNKTNARLFCLLLYYCSIFLYYDMGIMRQGISLSIVWFALKYVKKRDIKRFIIWLLVGAMFHVTALLAFPIYFLGNKRYKPRFYFMWLVIGLGISLAYNILIRLTIKYGGIYIAHKINAYTTYLNTESNLASLASTIIIRLGILVILYRSIRIIERRQKDVYDGFDDNALYFNAYYISIVEMIVFASLFILATRGTGVLYFCYIPIFSSVISNKKMAVHKRLIFFTIAIAFVTHTFLNTIEDSVGNLYIPYSTFFGG